MEEYQHRICELMAIFITCELRLSVDTTIHEQVLIGNRIVYIMRKHLVQEEEVNYHQKISIRIKLYNHFFFLQL